MNAAFLASRRKILPGQTTVTYAVAPAFTTSASIADAFKKPLQLSEYADAGVQLGSHACKWILWTAMLDAAGITKPKIGDKITDPNSVVWMVTHIDKGLLDQKVVLYCEKAKGN